MQLGDYIPNVKKKFSKIFFSGISFNSSNVKKNNIFFAIKGTKVDGNKFIQKAIKKGSKIYIEGELQTRKWQDQEGKDRYTTEVVLQGFGGNLTLLDSSRNSNLDTNKQNNNKEIEDSSNTSNADSSEMDDDIPF